MQQPEDSPLDYSALHICADCDRRHYLRVFPVRDGWVAGTGCGCQASDGGPKRYSTEVDKVFPTMDAAEVAISWLLHPSTVRAA